MRYSIAFTNLPFDPENRQVIYVDNQYEKRINTIIKDNYERIKWTFKRANIDFVYLPLLFDDDDIREKVLYYAPYLTSEIMEEMELRSNHLLKYMTHTENQDKIVPSLLFSPEKDNNGWTFQGVTIDIDDDNSFIEWFENAISIIEEDLAPIDSTDDRRFDEDHEVLKVETTEGASEGAEHVEYSSTPNFWERAKHGLKKFGKCILEEEINEGERQASRLDRINEEDISRTLEELGRTIERLRLLGIPLSVLAELVAKYETVSRLRITDDYRILLPDYNNIEVKMGPLYKAVYFLFINHPEGIILQRLEDYHHELVNYYQQTSGIKPLTPRMLDTINRLEYPGDNTINYTLSRIKAYVKATIDEHLAKHYYISGRPGEPYKIPLDTNYIEWEDEYE